MFQLKNIDVRNVALYSFIMFLIISLIFIIPFGLFFTFLSSIIPDAEYQVEAFSIFSGIFIFILPLFYAVLGTIVNVLVALLYNALSKKFGGIKLTVEKLDEMGQVIN